MFQGLFDGIITKEDKLLKVRQSALQVASAIAENAGQSIADF